MPYSLGHELFLIREENPLIYNVPVSEIMAGDVLEAAWICFNTYSENLNSRKTFMHFPKLWILGKRAAKCDKDLEATTFRAYREAGCYEFPLTQIFKPSSAAPARVPGAPFILRLHQFVMRHLGKSEAEAWDYPYGLAKMRWACHWEQEGGLEIYNENDATFDKFVAEQEAKDAEKGVK